jgi:hypothetical protein
MISLVYCGLQSIMPSLEFGFIQTRGGGEEKGRGKEKKEEGKKKKSSLTSESSVVG